MESQDGVVDLHRLMEQTPNMADSLHLVIGGEEQVGLCPKCRVLTPAAQDLPDTVQAWHANGCGECGFTGRLTRFEWQAWYLDSDLRRRLACAATLEDTRRALRGDERTEARTPTPT
jgi:hypothetical protein